MKRTSQIVLVLMGVTAVGATAVSILPKRECPPAQSGSATQSAEDCEPRRSSRKWFPGVRFGSDADTTSTRSQSPRFHSRTSTPRSTTSHTTTQRGGFGSTGRSVSSRS